jgi:hypothetical protein
VSHRTPANTANVTILSAAMISIFRCFGRIRM